MATRRFRIVGPGRAGTSMGTALRRRGWTAATPVGRGDDLGPAAREVDVVVLATPDGSVEDVARQIEPVVDTVVVHLSGALGVEVLGRHPHRGAVHPLVSLPEAGIGAERLLGGAWYGVAWDTAPAETTVRSIVEDLGGSAVAVAPQARVAYHAAATIAANHLVALLAQAEEVAAAAGVPLDAYLDLAAGALDNVRRVGAGAALTGPVARGDWATVRSHRRALPDGELEAYDALSRRAARLAGRPWEADPQP